MDRAGREEGVNFEIGMVPQRFQKGLTSTGRIGDALYPNHPGRDRDERMMGETQDMAANKRAKNRVEPNWSVRKRHGNKDGRTVQRYLDVLPGPGKR